MFTAHSFSSRSNLGLKAPFPPLDFQKSAGRWPNSKDLVFNLKLSTLYDFLVIKKVIYGPMPSGIGSFHFSKVEINCKPWPT